MNQNDTLFTKIMEMLEDPDMQLPDEHHVFVKIVEVYDSSEEPKVRYCILPVLTDWGYWRYFQTMHYGERLKSLDVDLEAEPMTITVSLTQNEFEKALAGIIEHAAATDDPVAAASAALHRMFPEPSV